MPDKILPADLMLKKITRYRQHDYWRKVAKNTGWLMAERICKLALGVLVMIWLARYLGPTQYGIYSYSIAVVALFAQISMLGLNGIVVRDLVNDEVSKNEVLGTAWLLKAVGGIVGAILSVITIYFLEHGQWEYVILIGILSIGTLVKTFEVIEFYFEAHILSRYTAIAKISAMVMSMLAVAILIMRGSSIEAFVAVRSMELLGIAVLLLVFYHRYGTVRQWRFNTARAKGFLKRSWPLVISGFGSIIYLKIDQIMLANMVSVEATGIYAVAAQLSELWYFVPLIIMSSLFPKLIESKKGDEKTYKERLQKLYDLMWVLAFTLAALVSLVSNFVVDYLYGDMYSQASGILAIHIWASLFVFMRAVFSKWLIIENLYLFSLITHGAGALVNVGLNIVMIPQWAGLGAAVATLLSYATASYFSLFFHRKTIEAAQMMSRSLIVPVRYLRKVITP